jgi:hypothetical protein
MAALDADSSQEVVALLIASNADANANDKVFLAV